MNGIKICGTGSAIPAAAVSNADLARIVRTDDEWIRSRTGIERRHVAKKETHLSLCTEAARSALAQANLDPSQIGVCIVATFTPDTIVPSAACLLQRELSLPQDCMCFDLNAACSGFLYALHTAECLLAASPYRHALIVGGECLSRVLDWRDRSTCILFGDGAGAAVASFSPENTGLHAVVGCSGDDRILRVCGPGLREKPHVSMEGQAVFRFAVEAVPRCIGQVLERTGLTIGDIDQVVFHQANARIIDLAARKCRIPPHKVSKNIAEYGNTSAASVPILLDELHRSGKLPSGFRALCVAFGGGLTWAGALLEFE